MTNTASFDAIFLKKDEELDNLTDNLTKIIKWNDIISVDNLKILPLFCLERVCGSAC